MRRAPTEQGRCLVAARNASPPRSPAAGRAHRSAPWRPDGAAPRSPGPSSCGSSLGQFSTSGPNNRCQARPSAPSPAAVSSTLRCSTPARPPSSGWASGISGHDPPQPVLAERVERQRRRRYAEGVDGGAHVVHVAGQRELGRPRSATDHVGGLEHQHRPAGFRQPDRSRQPVRARPDDDRVESLGSSSSARPAAAGSDDRLDPRGRRPPSGPSEPAQQPLDRLDLVVGAVGVVMEQQHRCRPRTVAPTRPRTRPPSARNRPGREVRRRCTGRRGSARRRRRTARAPPRGTARDPSGPGPITPAGPWSDR